MYQDIIRNIFSRQQAKDDLCFSMSKSVYLYSVQILVGNQRVNSRTHSCG